MSALKIANAAILSCLPLITQATTLDPADRWQVRDYYNSVYFHKVNSPMSWTGNHDSGDPGSVSDDWLEATLNRINYFRTVAGVPAGITFDPGLNAMCQQSALMMSANTALSHFPPQSWTHWTADGYEAANKGNIALGSAGAMAIEGYMMDPGSNNAEVGHRRWILLPHTKRMGSGDVAGTSGNPRLFAANTLWVNPVSFGSRPDPRDDFVAWPPPGHIPAQTVWPRWSLTYPNADFSNATVTMTSGGNALPVGLEPFTFYFGSYPESTLVWIPNGMNPDELASWPVPAGDQPIQVTVNNVKIGNQTRNFQYTVTIIDPAEPGPSEFSTTVSTAGTIYRSVPAFFQRTGRGWAESFEIRAFTGEPYSAIHGAESGQNPFIVNTSSGYSPIQSTRKSAGSSAFHLAHPEYASQILSFPDQFAITANSPFLEFMSSLSLATGTQTATVEMRLGGSGEWMEIWSQAGTSSYNTQFTRQTIPLSQYAGETAEFRFHYKVVTGQSFYSNTAPEYGWAIDAITLNGLLEVGENEPQDPGVEGTRFAAVLDAGETVHMQLRDVAFDGIPMAWGPVLEVTPQSLPVLQAAPGTWVPDPVFDWAYGATGDWRYSVATGYMNVAEFPWLYTRDGWVAYLYGSLPEGIWIYDPGTGVRMIN